MLLTPAIFLWWQFKLSAVKKAYREPTVAFFIHVIHMKFTSRWWPHGNATFSSYWGSTQSSNKRLTSTQWILGYWQLQKTPRVLFSKIGPNEDCIIEMVHTYYIIFQKIQPLNWDIVWPVWKFGFNIVRKAQVWLITLTMDLFHLDVAVSHETVM